ncbi:leader peptide processing enzyme [Treponema sp. OttesenSCG-928-L16]|nr:leader peptide processing enzyme [Treponema sp. OttesenSCG-928-L16]
MSKKSNTLLFILGATVFNIVITLASFALLLVIYAKFLAPVLPEELAAWGLPVIFIVAIVLSFVVYRYVLKFLMKKINAEEHFDPLFGPRKPPVRKD